MFKKKHHHASAKKMGYSLHRPLAGKKSVPELTDVELLRLYRETQNFAATKFADLDTLKRQDFIGSAKTGKPWPKEEQKRFFGEGMQQGFEDLNALRTELERRHKETGLPLPKTMQEQNMDFRDEGWRQEHKDWKSLGPARR